MTTKLEFGSEPNMSEVPLGQHAVLSLQPFDKWSIKETEYGPKCCIPIVLHSHPSYDSIPSKGMQCDWVSKSKAIEGIFYYIYEEGAMVDDLKVKTFDFDVQTVLNGKWKLTRFETGAYKAKQI